MTHHTSAVCLQVWQVMCCVVQLYAVLVAWRNRWATAIRLLAPLLFLALALLVQEVMAVNARRTGRIRDTPVTAPAAISSIPDCSTELFIHNKPCMDFVYSPVNSTKAQVGDGNTCICARTRQFAATRQLLQAACGPQPGWPASMNNAALCSFPAGHCECNFEQQRPSHTCEQGKCSGLISCQLA